MADPTVDMPSVVGDFLKAVGPVVAAPGVDLDLGISEMKLHAITIELISCEPALAARHLVDRRFKRRCNEAGVVGLDAFALLVFYAETPPTPGPTQAHSGAPEKKFPSMSYWA